MRGEVWCFRELINLRKQSGIHLLIDTQFGEPTVNELF